MDTVTKYTTTTSNKLIFIFAPKMREQLESERRRGEAELRGEIRKEMDKLKLREEVAEVQVIVENDDGDHTGESRKGG